jgi:hypothetical protein
MALLFWGWQSGYLLATGLMAAILKSSRILQARWEFTDKDFDRIGNFCTVLFLGAALYAFTSNHGPSALKALVQSPSSATPASAAYINCMTPCRATTPHGLAT